MAMLTKMDGTKLASGPALLLCQLLLCEQPAPSKARYPPVPPSSTLKISSVFVQMGVVDHLRQRLTDAADQLKSAHTGAALHFLEMVVHGHRFLDAGRLAKYNPAMEAVSHIIDLLLSHMKAYISYSNHISSDHS